MATPNQLQATDTDLAIGESCDTTVTFVTDPGTPDVNDTVELTLNGTVVSAVATIPVVLRGRAAEPTPTVTAGNAATGWALRLRGGSRPVVALGGNKFRITN